jgi:hypothetical protein
MAKHRSRTYHQSNLVLILRQRANGSTVRSEVVVTFSCIVNRSAFLVLFVLGSFVHQHGCLPCQGISRSPSIVIAYLIRQHAMTYDDALALCKSTRACVKPNRGFVRSLREWEARCRDKRLQSTSSSVTPAAPNPSGAMSRPDLTRRFTN